MNCNCLDFLISLLSSLVSFVCLGIFLEVMVPRASMASSIIIFGVNICFLAFLVVDWGFCF